MVEFALVAPVLCLLLFAVIDFGLILSDDIGLRQGVREAARQATVGDVGTASCTPVGASAGSADMKKVICLAKARSDVGGSGMRVAVRFATASGTTATDLSSDYKVGNALIVCALTPMESRTGFFNPLLGGNYMRTKVVMRIEKVAAGTQNAALETAPAGQDWTWCQP